MSLKRSNPPNRINSPQSPAPRESWPKRNEHWIQVVLTFLTLATIIITSYYSHRSLNEIHQSNLTADSAYRLNAMQWDTVKKENKLKAAAELDKDIQDAIKYTADTDRVAARDRFQTEAFNEQLKVYKGQLSAIKIQADIAKKQFEYQNELNRQLIITNRPIFMLKSTSYDTTKQIASFSFQNYGKRPAAGIQLSMCAINPSHLITYANIDSLSTLDLTENTTATAFITMPKWDYFDAKTIFYVYLKYNDPAYKLPRVFYKYFRYENTPATGASWFELFNERRFVIDASKVNKFPFPVLN